MRILVCHTYYRQRSGECAVVEREVELLRSRGHEVSLFTYDNRDADSTPGIRLAARAVYSRQTKSDLRRFVADQTYDLAHVHNTWLMASPSLFPALASLGIPVAKTIHNYRWLCPVATLYRDGHRCHDCLERPGGNLHAIVHRCFGGSVGGSLVAASRLTIARDILRVYQRYVDAIIVQNAFVRGMLVRAGFEASRMITKGNFLQIPPGITPSRGDYLAFFGRHEPSKGLATLLAAMENVSVPLRVFGEGPMTSWLTGETARRFGTSGRVDIAGHVPRRTLDEAIAGSRAVVFPSEWYESYPLSIVEAMAFGKPVIASNLGGAATIVEDGVNGLLFSPGDAEALAGCVRRLWQDDRLQDRLEAGARETYYREMTPEVSYTRLIEAYDAARQNHAKRTGETL
jgi:glycosyltransferase involved in cell wall biosynthesis